MTYQSEYQIKFKALENHLQNIEQLRRQANGGNCVLFSYEPKDEQKYIIKAKELYKSTAKFISLSEILQNYIKSDGWENFKNYYEDFKETPDKIFKSDSSDDYFNMIINEIKKAELEDKIPMIIRTGALYGTCIDNQNIMENKCVMELKKPLVIFYPSTKKDNRVLFLGVKEASKYRCQVI